jgi:hypothetical protein
VHSGMLRREARKEATNGRKVTSQLAGAERQGRRKKFFW